MGRSFLGLCAQQQATLTLAGSDAQLVITITRLAELGHLANGAVQVLAFVSSPRLHERALNAEKETIYSNHCYMRLWAMAPKKAKVKHRHNQGKAKIARLRSKPSHVISRTL